MRITFNKKSIIWAVITSLVVLAIVLGLIFGLKENVKFDGAVVSNGIGCADIGGQILYEGGSAVDSAIATLLCEGVMLPHSMGIGGGFVATLYNKKLRKIETVIARETAPAVAHKDMFKNQTSVVGVLAGAVPGELLGYWQMHRKYGRLPWKYLFQPTIKLCFEGHIVSKYLGAAIKSKEKQIRDEPSMSELYVKSDGSLIQAGDYMKRIQLGKTLKKVAEIGVGVFYDGGEVGQAFVNDLQKLGGKITIDDLKNYKVKWYENDHIVANITDNYMLYTTQLPSSGALLVFMLNVMEGLYTNDREIFYQRIVETFKHSYGLRTNLGDLENDSEMAPIINETFRNLISPDFAKSIRNLIHDNVTSFNINDYGANFTIEENNGTANMAVLAPNGDAVAITSTINNYFGCKVRSSNTGIILNDEMDDFSTPGLVNSFGVPASPANYIQPGKRPMSSMNPAIILDKNGNVRMLVGAAGGTKITTAVALAIFKYLIFKEPISAAVNDGRIHHQLVPMRVDAEAEVPENIRNYLKSVGHNVNVASDGGFAALTAIGNRDGVPEPFYDRRRVGSTALVQGRNMKIDSLAIDSL